MKIKPVPHNITSHIQIHSFFQLLQFKPVNFSGVISSVTEQMPFLSMDHERKHNY